MPGERQLERMRPDAATLCACSGSGKAARRMLRRSWGCEVGEIGPALMGAEIKLWDRYRTTRDAMTSCPQQGQIGQTLTGEILADSRLVDACLARAAEMLQPSEMRARARWRAGVWGRALGLKPVLRHAQTWHWIRHLSSGHTSTQIKTRSWTRSVRPVSARYIAKAAASRSENSAKQEGRNFIPIGDRALPWSKVR